MLCPLCDGHEVLDRGGLPPLYYCTACEVAYQWPQPTQQQLERYYDHTLDVSYLFKYADAARSRARLHARHVDKKPPASVFDIGCGTGDYLVAFRELGWSVSGLEISTELADIARQQHGLDIVTDDFMSRRFDSQYDAVSAQHVIEHVPDPLAFLDKAATLLTDRGHLLLAAPNYQSLLNEWVGSRWLLRAEPTHLFHFTTGGVRKLAKRIGLDIVVCTTWQYDMADVLWALKARLLLGPPTEDHRPRPADVAAQPETEAAVASTGASFRRSVRSVAVSAAALARPWIGRAGRGSEIIAVLRKR